MDVCGYDGFKRLRLKDIKFNLISEKTVNVGVFKFVNVIRTFKI